MDTFDPSGLIFPILQSYGMLGYSWFKQNWGGNLIAWPNLNILDKNSWARSIFWFLIHITPWWNICFYSLKNSCSERSEIFLPPRSIIVPNYLFIKYNYFNIILFMCSFRILQHYYQLGGGWQCVFFLLDSNFKL